MPSYPDLFGANQAGVSGKSSSRKVFGGLRRTAQPPNHVDEESTPRLLPYNTSMTTPSHTNYVSNCYCCGLVLAYPEGASKFKCTVCDTTNFVTKDSLDGKKVSYYPKPVTYDELFRLLNQCMANAQTMDGPNCLAEQLQNRAQTLHTIFEPLSKRLYDAFRSVECLRRSFLLNYKRTTLHYSKCNLDLNGIRNLFNLLTRLPTKRPLYNALSGAVELLKRVSFQPQDDARRLYHLLILLEIPYLTLAMVPRTTSLASSPLNSRQGSAIFRMVDVPEIRNLLREILSKSLGTLSQSITPNSSNYICSWWAKLPNDEFIQKVENFNLYITFYLRRYFEKVKQIDRKRAINYRHPITAIADNNNKESEVNVNDSQHKIKINQYGDDWHLRAASIILAMLFKANTVRGFFKIPCHFFYNSMVDFVHVKLDFDSWQKKQREKTVFNSSERGPSPTANSPPDIQTVIEYIQDSDRARSMLVDSASFYFCQYPFLISLGAKISILEYEARRKMERKAEEAFISSLDKKVAEDVYFRVKVRRDHIVQDSLYCIQSNTSNLMKSLKVQFINEPGIDAGGLKKEWFLLLTKEIFGPQTGMLVEVEESNCLWFNMVPIDNLEMYYLFGAILGLAIYNSTILDLHFPLSIYKTLLNKTLTFEDYSDIYPEVARNLLKLKTYSSDELSMMDLTFEVTITDAFGKTYTRELIPKGRKTRVTKENLGFYIDRYSSYFICDGILPQLKLFVNGFKTVIGGNALSLFHPEEIELLICGSDENYLDIDILKSITKYVGFKDRESAERDATIAWFWEYMHLMDYTSHKKFLRFVTGSDRVPATGLQNLSFKISKAGTSFSERLPIAHTCFNELSLYTYKNKETLVRKMTLAVNESLGFGIK